MVPAAQKNRFADIAFGATVVNLLSWLLVAVPGFLLSVWSMFVLVTIPLSTMIALVAGVMGVRNVKASGTGLWQSWTGIVVGVLSLVMIILGLVGIYAMVNAPF